MAERPKTKLELGRDVYRHYVNKLDHLSHFKPEVLLYMYTFFHQYYWQARNYSERCTGKGRNSKPLNTTVIPMSAGLLTTFRHAVARPALRTPTAIRLSSTGTSSAHPLAQTEDNASSSSSGNIVTKEPKEVLTAEVVSGAPGALILQQVVALGGSI